MIVLLFETTLRDEGLRDEYENMAGRMRELARQTPGFVSWEDYRGADGRDMGVVTFETDEALAAWRDHPDHGAVHRRGQEAVYASYRVQVCQVVRDASFSVATTPDEA